MSQDHEFEKVGFYFGPTSESTSGRLKREKALLEYTRRNPEPWTQVSGCYDFHEHHSLLNMNTIPTEAYRKLSSTDFQEHPTFHTFFIKNLIPSVLAQTEQSGKTSVFLDIGGGTGFTWRQAASVYKREVRNGQLAFVVSNLNDSPKQLEEKARANLCNRKGTNDGYDLVTYIQAPFRELGSQRVSLPNGQKIPLKDHVDLAHESWSLTAWSCVPELDIPSAAELLSQRGIYAVSPQEKAFKYADLDKIGEAETDQHIRTSWIRKAQDGLTRFGLSRISQVEDGSLKGTRLRYTIFRKQAAPKIEI